MNGALELLAQLPIVVSLERLAQADQYRLDVRIPLVAAAAFTLLHRLLLLLLLQLFLFLGGGFLHRFGLVLLADVHSQHVLLALHLRFLLHQRERILVLELAILFFLELIDTALEECGTLRDHTHGFLVIWRRDNPL